jgi:hypothetical protein
MQAARSVYKRTYAVYERSDNKSARRRRLAHPEAAAGITTLQVLYTPKPAVMAGDRAASAPGGKHLQKETSVL